MSELTIITNHQPRDVIEAYELTEEERNEFDYIKWDKIEEGEDSATFFRYKGELYDLGEFETTSRMIGHKFAKWDGYKSETFFSGILVKRAFRDGYDWVIVGRYYS